MPLAPQELLAVTFTFPLPVPHVTSMLVLPCPAVMVPFETVQLLAGCGDTDVTLKVTNPPLHHAPGNADSVLGVFGFPLIEIVRGVLVPGVHRVVLAVTVRFPVVNDDPTLKRIVVLPCPLVIVVVPAGGVHV